MSDNKKRNANKYKSNNKKSNNKELTDKKTNNNKIEVQKTNVKKTNKKKIDVQKSNIKKPNTKNSNSKKVNVQKPSVKKTEIKTTTIKKTTKTKKTINHKRNIGYLVATILLMIISASATSYAVFKVTASGTKNYKFTVGSLDFELQNETNSIRLMNAFPMSDEYGTTLNPYKFTLNNTGDMKMYYRVSLEEDDDQKKACTGCQFLLNNKLKFELKEGTEVVSGPRLLSEVDNILTKGIIERGQTKNFELRLWIREEATAEVENKYFFARIKIEGQTEDFKDEDTSGANSPILASGMIPVVYDESQKTWVKADTSSEWYNYSKQMWANAVTVTSQNRSTYLNAAPGTEIPMSNINTMWVWIPRYEYQYTDLGTNYAGGTKTEPGEIKVKFVSASQTTPSDSTTYKIPEGFKFGNEELSGFWIGKFESSTLETCNATIGSVGTDCDLATLTPQIKPNVTSWRGARISTLWKTSRSMQKENANVYGFDNASAALDTHMLKNTEWGIVAMLSQSKYGKYGNPNYTGANKEVAINNCINYITGIAGDTISDSPSSTTCTTNTYETEKGQSASTTGTIYGVYDMSGGTYEYVMGNYNNLSGTSATINSGFCGTNGPTNGCVELPYDKYLDLYVSVTASDGYKQGDATYETSSWYGDNIYFIDSDNPWFIRGGHFSNATNAGVFLFLDYNGYADNSFGSRLALKT